MHLYILVKWFLINVVCNLSYTALSDGGRNVPSAFQMTVTQRAYKSICFAYFLKFTLHFFFYLAYISDSFWIEIDHIVIIVKNNVLHPAYSTTALRWNPIEKYDS